MSDDVALIQSTALVVKTGASMALGSEISFNTGIDFAGRGYVRPPREYKVIAGSFLNVNVFAGSVSPIKLEKLQAKLEATKTTLESADQAQIASLTRDDILGDMFYAGGLGYYAQLLSLSYISGLKAGGYYQLAGGYGTIGYEPEVNTSFGQPTSIRTGGVALDIPLIYVTADKDGDAEKKRQFTLQVGTLSSALEHITPDQMFAPTDPNEPQPDAISAVKALQKASAAGQKIYQINQANMNQVLPILNHDQATRDEIISALNAGKYVTTHTDAVSIPGGWSGFGYIITDPVTGDGAYKISGGKNGGEIGDVDKGSGLISLIGTMVDVVDWIFSKTNIDASRLGQFGQVLSISSSILSSVSISQKCSKDIARVLILFSTFLTLLSMAPFLLLGVLLNPIGAILFSLALSVGFGFGTQYLQNALCKAR